MEFKWKRLLFGGSLYARAILCNNNNNKTKKKRKSEKSWSYGNHGGGS